MLSKRVQVLSPSLTIAISSQARMMKANGEDVISLSAGEPDFDTPQILKDEAIKAIDDGFSKYTAVAGCPQVLEAIATKFKRDNNLSYRPDQIITNVGAKHSLFNIFQCILNEGDEVIIPIPAWVSYPEIVKFSGGKPVTIETYAENDFKITPEELKNAISARTKAIVINTPNNPSGALYSRDEIRALGEVLKGTKVLVVSDEIYEKVNFTGEFCSVASVSDDLFLRTITINGLSKCGAMTGWRFGYTASAIDELNQAMKNLQSQSVSNITSIVQKAAIPSLLGESDADIEMMKNEYQKRRDYAVSAINAIDGLSVNCPQGAFYLFVNCSLVERDSMKFCKMLLEREKVALIPGIGFGMDGYFRLSFATDLESIKKGIARIAKFVSQYKA